MNQEKELPRSLRVAPNPESHRAKVSDGCRDCRLGSLGRAGSGRGSGRDLSGFGFEGSEV